MTNYFHHLGVYRPDNISSIILTSLHRTLNKKDLRVREQVQGFQKYDREIANCESKQQDRAESNYKKFDLGDTITIKMPVDTSYGAYNAVMYMCPNPEWTFDKNKDLILKGRVEKKYFINSPTNVFFAVKVKSLNRKNIDVLGKKISVGGVIDLSLRGLTIE